MLMLQHAARAVIQTRYTWDLVTQQYEDLLLDLTQER